MVEHYMTIPGKVNGLDIDGLAVDGHRLLRGPVLRGWSTLQEVAIEARGNQLLLVPLDNSGAMLRKHFLQLDGLGIRDRQFSGDDLHIQGGPTMVLNGEIRVCNWPAARPLLAPIRESVRFEAALTEPVPLARGRVTNRAEAICSLPPTLLGGKAARLVRRAGRRSQVAICDCGRKAQPIG